MAQKILNGVHISGTTQIDFMPTHESEGILTLGRYDANTSRYHNIKSYVSSTQASNYLKFSLHTGEANTVVDVLTLKGDSSATFAGNLTVTGSTTMAGVNPTSLTTPLIQLQGDLNILNKAQTSYLTLADRDTSGSEVVYNLSNLGTATFAGSVSAEDNIFLTDAGTVRAKLLLNADDRDNVELRAESLGSTMKFFTVGTEALELDASQNATFSGDQVRVDTAGGGFYLRNTSGTFRGAFHDNGTTTNIFGDGNGSTPALSIESNNVTFAGTIGSGNINISDGTPVLTLTDTSSSATSTLTLDGVNLTLQNNGTNGDFTIIGRDGSSNINLLAFDTSEGGIATFSGAATYHKIQTYYAGDYTSGFKFSDYNGGIWYDAGADDLTLNAGHANSQILFNSGGELALTLDASQAATFKGSGTFETILNVIATDDGGSPAMTSRINMHGYDGRGVGIKMKDNVTTSGGGDDNEWFIGTGYNQSGFNIGYASDGSQSSYSAQAKLQISTAGNATFAGDVSGVAMLVNPSYADSNEYLSIHKRQSRDGGIVFRSKPTGGSGQNDWQVLNHASTGDLRFYAYGLSGFALTLDRENANATFASTITTNSGGVIVSDVVDGDFTALRLMNQKTYGTDTGTNEKVRFVMGISESGQTFANREGFVIDVGVIDQSDSSNIKVDFQVRDGGTVGTYQTVHGHDKEVEFIADARVNGWIKGASDTNTLYSSTSLGTYLQSPANSGTGGSIFLRNHSGTVFQEFSQVAGGISTIKNNLYVQADDADFLVRSADYTISRIISRGSSGANLDKGLFSLMSSDGTNNNVEKVRIDSAGLSWFDGGNTRIGGDLEVTGNLTIQGSTTTINTQTVEVEDNIIKLNKTQGSPATITSNTSGISVYRGVDGDGNEISAANLIFDDGDDTWDLTHNLKVAGNLEVAGSNIELGGNWTVQGTDGTYFQRIKTIDSSSTNAVDTFSFDVKLGSSADWKSLLVLDQHDAARFSGDISAPGLVYDGTNKYLSISHWASPPTPAAMIHLSDNSNDLDVPQIRIEGRENPGDTVLDVAVKDADVRFNLVEGTTDASSGYGKMHFKTNANSNSTHPTRGGFLFQIGAGTVINALTITNEGNAIFDKNISMTNGNASGKFAVSSTGVHPSFDFYNNGTSYFNGSVTIDSAFTQSGGSNSSFSGDVVIPDNKKLHGGGVHPISVYNTTGNNGFLVETDLASNAYHMIQGEFDLVHFNSSTKQRIEFSATLNNNGTVFNSKGTADIDVTIKLFVYNSKWYVHVPQPNTYTTCTGYVSKANAYSGDRDAENRMASITATAVPSSGVSGSTDVVCKFTQGDVTLAGNLTTTGDVEAARIIRTDGTSSQYLMADGTVSTSSFNGGTITDSVLINYTGNDGNNNDAGLKIMNDSNDWGAYIRKNNSGNYGLRIDSGGSSALSIYSTTGGSAKTFGVDGSDGDTSIAGTLSVGGGDTASAQLALKGQQGLLSLIRGTSGDSKFFISADSSRLYFSHTDIQSNNLIFKIDASDKLTTFLGGVFPSQSIQYKDTLAISSGTNGAWKRIGRWAEVAQSGETLKVTINGGSGYNANYEQQGQLTIHLRSSNGSSTVSASNGDDVKFNGYYYQTGFKPLALAQIRVVAVDADTNDIYMYTASHIGKSFVNGETSKGSRFIVQVDSPSLVSDFSGADYLDLHEEYRTLTAHVHKNLLTVGRETPSSTTNREDSLRLRGKNNYSDGTTQYGDYGQLIFHATTNMTGSARRILLTNAYLNNRFAIIQSASANADPVTNSSSSGLDAGGVLLDFDNSANATFHNKLGVGVSPSTLLHLRGAGDAIRVESTNGGAGGAQIDLLHWTTSPADEDTFGMINMGGYYSGTTSVYGSQILSKWTDVSERHSRVEFKTCDTTLSTVLTLDHEKQATFTGIVTTDKIFVAKGQNVTHGTSQIKISQENTTKSQIRFYGADTSTAGILEFTGSSSDGSVGGVRLTINANGSSTFGGDVTADSFIKDGGTSSQYLMADGSVSTGGSGHNHDDRYYTETEIDSNFYGKVATDARFTSTNGTEDNWVFQLGDESNMSGNKWYKVATVNQGSGGLHIRGFLSNHVESFGTQKVDLAIQGREGGSNTPIEITGRVDVLHNASSGTDKVGIRIVKSDTTSSAYYHYYDVYIRTTRYTQAEFHLTKKGGVSFHTSKPSVTSEPAPVSGGNVELDTSSLSEGNFVVNDSSIKRIIVDNHPFDVTLNEKLDIRGSGYNQIKIATNLTADTNKQSGITTENYEGNNVSIFQTFQQNNSNAIYYGSADSAHRGLQSHYFMVNADSDATSNHSTALHINSAKTSTFYGTVSAPFITAANPNGAANGSAQEVARFVNTKSGATSSYMYIGASSGTDWRLGKNIMGTSSNTNFGITKHSGTALAMEIDTDLNVSFPTGNVSGNRFTSNVNSGTNIELRKGAGYGALGFGGTTHQTGLIEGVDGGGLKLYTAGEDEDWGGSWSLNTIWSGQNMSVNGSITGGSIISNGDITASGADLTLSHSNAPGIYLRRDDTSTEANNSLGAIYFQSDDPTDGTFNTGAYIQAFAHGEWSSGSYSSYLKFFTRNTSGGNIEALNIKKNGAACFYSQTAPVVLANRSATSVAHWSQSGNSTGMIQITLPGTRSGNWSMFVFRITSYEYSSNAHTVYHVSGHDWTSGWYNRGVSKSGPSDKDIRFASDSTTNKDHILLGTTSSSWSYGHVTVDVIAHPSFYHYSLDISDGWSISKVTSNPNGIVTHHNNKVIDVTGGLISGELQIVKHGTATSANLEITNTGSDAFNHSINCFASGLEAGEANLIVVGKSGSTRNSGYLGYVWSTSNSNDSYMSIGLWGDDHILRVHGNKVKSMVNFEVSGTIVATGDITAFSDKRLKDNVETIDGALDKVLKLRGVSYNRNDLDDESKKIGVIAQEVNEVVPEVVNYHEDDDRYSVAYGNMAGLFIEAIKELKAEVADLKAEIKELKSK